MVDTDCDLVTLLLKSKSKIWEDKKRLGLLGEKQSCEKTVTTSQHSPVHAEHGRSHEIEEKHNFCDSVRERKKDLLISCITSASPGFGDHKEHNTQPMVRFGEYSPQNPGLLSPGKTLLGLGEYEEKRRQILERKKHEYLEQMVQARQEVKDAVSGRIAELNQQQDSSELRLKPHLNIKHTAGTQTDTQVTDYMQDAEPSPLAEYSSDISPMAASTKTPSREVSVLPNLSLHPQITTAATLTPDGSVKLSNYASVPATDTPGASGIIVLPQHASYMPLSPRERKMVEFRESYSPSFLQGHPFRRGGFDTTTDQTNICRRKQAYQEELRMQIEEKQRIEAEQQKKEKEEEEAIARRVELQQERMRQEYIQEEALRRDKHRQRLHQAEDFRHRQAVWKLEAEGSQKTEARRKLGKRLKDLEAGLAQHSTYSTQILGVSLPVPALRSKYFFSQSPMETMPSSCAASSAIHDVADDVIRDSNTRIFDARSSSTVNTVEDNTVEKTQRDSSVAYPLHNKTADKCSPQINHLEYSVHKSDSEYLLNNYSTGKDTSEHVTISYHRPPNEIIKAAHYDSSVKKCHVGSVANGLELLDPRRHCELPVENVQHVSSLLPQSTNNCGKKLDDSLPIPVLRTPSPVIPTATIGQAAACSDGVRKLEGKWQVPAVVRNVVHGSSGSNNILTQLGAMRHQLQLEQIRMEQHLQQQQQLRNKS